MGKGKCGIPDYTGDGRCDDENNNCACGWDQGDCCGSSGDKYQFSYCKKCQCKDPKVKKKGGCPGKKNCGAAAYVGDGRCDDNNNNCGCGWDKGDCCGTTGDSRQFLYCSKCQCIDPSFAKKKCSGACKNVQFKADGRCDDANNNCGCGWDGGDCCGASGDKRQWSYCSKCKCKDPKFKKTSKCPSSKGGCLHASWVGDGRCDDGNNNCACNWDKGDCCGKSGDKRQYEYCSKCKCLDPTKKKAGCPKSGQCGAKSFVGDKRCDDENNNCGCNWDGGDCCGKSGDTRQFSYCKACKCLDPANAKKKCGGKCKSPGFKGDKRCDDGNNNCGCNWDDGDCCGSSGDKYQFSYCKKCKCLDPLTLKNCKGHCAKPNYKKDGYCDEGNNNCGCAYDGGDCCGKTFAGKHQFSHCKGKAGCKCLDPSKGGGK